MLVRVPGTGRRLKSLGSTILASDWCKIVRFILRFWPLVFCSYWSASRKYRRLATLTLFLIVLGFELDEIFLVTRVLRSFLVFG